MQALQELRVAVREPHEVFERERIELCAASELAPASTCIIPILKDVSQAWLASLESNLLRHSTAAGLKEASAQLIH